MKGDELKNKNKIDQKENGELFFKKLPNRRIGPNL
jgi:hypothetical protein